MQEFIPFVLRRNKPATRIVALLIPMVLLFVSLSQTVFARTTYVITDGDQVTVYTTYASADPAKVLTDAGVELNADDTYTTQATEGGAEITVQRAQAITITYGGKSIETSSCGETVELLLTRLGIPTQGEYCVSLPLWTPTADGMEITVNRVIHTEETCTVDIPYEIAYCYDPTLPEGTEEVLVAGTAGQLQRRTSVTYINAEESSRTLLEETVLSQPVNQITLVGTGNGSASSSAPAIGDGVIVTATGEVLTYSKAMQFKATAYTHTDEGCNMITSTSTTVRIGTVAVDPTVIPYGTRMFIMSNDGKYVYGIATAEDCGGAIQNERLDLYFPTTDECFQFGVRNCTVYFLD